MRRIVSSVISVIYLLASYSAGGTKIFLEVLVLLVLPITCIWFGDVISKRITGRGARYITKDLTGCLIVLIGWVLLLLPGIIIIISIATVKK